MARRVIPFPRPGRPPEAAPRFVELVHVRDQAEALVVRGLLEAHGVEVILRTHLAPSVHPFTVGDQAAVQLLVPQEDLGRSRLLLARAAPGPSR